MFDCLCGERWQSIRATAKARRRDDVIYNAYDRLALLQSTRLETCVEKRLGARDDGVSPVIAVTLAWCTMGRLCFKNSRFRRTKLPPRTVPRRRSSQHCRASVLGRPRVPGAAHLFRIPAPRQSLCLWQSPGGPPLALAATRERAQPDDAAQRSPTVHTPYRAGRVSDPSLGRKRGPATRITHLGARSQRPPVSPQLTGVAQSMPQQGESLQ